MIPLLKKRDPALMRWPKGHFIAGNINNGLFFLHGYIYLTSSIIVTVAEKKLTKVGYICRSSTYKRFFRSARLDLYLISMARSVLLRQRLKRHGCIPAAWLFWSRPGTGD